MRNEKKQGLKKKRNEKNQKLNETKLQKSRSKKRKN
jgi:hypothetical protein